MLDLLASGPELSFPLFDLLTTLASDHHRQHLLVHIYSCLATIYWFHMDLLVIAATEDRFR
jgi:hypothetical protein